MPMIRPVLAPPDESSCSVAVVEEPEVSACGDVVTVSVGVGVNVGVDVATVVLVELEPDALEEFDELLLPEPGRYDND